MADSIAGETRLRDIDESDRAFLVRVYASTREREMQLTGWPPAQQEQFLRSQFDTQHSYYQQIYPTARYRIIERGGELIGRLYVNEEPAEIRVIDIALLPAYRGTSIGTALLQSLLLEADHSGSAVTIHVEGNNPAIGLYSRLGFRQIEDRGVYKFMRREPGPTPAA